MIGQTERVSVYNLMIPEVGTSKFGFDAEKELDVNDWEIIENHGREVMLGHHMYDDLSYVTCLNILAYDRTKTLNWRPDWKDFKRNAYHKGPLQFYVNAAVLSYIFDETKKKLSIGSYRDYIKGTHQPGEDEYALKFTNQQFNTALGLFPEELENWRTGDNFQLLRKEFKIARTEYKTRLASYAKILFPEYISDFKVDLEELKKYFYKRRMQMRSAVRAGLSSDNSDMYSALQYATWLSILHADSVEIKTTGSRLKINSSLVFQEISQPVPDTRRF